MLLDTLSLVVDERVEELCYAAVRVRAPELEGRGDLQIGLYQDKGAIIFPE